MESESIVGFHYRAIHANGFSRHARRDIDGNNKPFVCGIKIIHQLSISPRQWAVHASAEKTVNNDSRISNG